MSYNLTREAQAILEQHGNSPPSFSVQLYHDNWTLNSGPKFLYNSPAYTALFDDIKANRIPVDLLELFDAAKVPFYEGCMIVEIEEFKQVNSKDNAKESKTLEKSVTRVLLRPNSETLFADLCLLNQKSGSKWTDRDALEVEAKILLATAPPLCLDPDPRLGKIANSLYRISLPRTPPPLRPKKRKANGLESTEEDEASWNRKAKIIRFMDPKPTRNAPSYRLLDHIIHSKNKTATPPPPPPGAHTIRPEDPPLSLSPPSQYSTPKTQSQTLTQTPSQPQPHSHSQSQSQSQPQLQPQPPPQPEAQTQPQPQPQPQSQSQSQPPPQAQPQPQTQTQTQPQPQSQPQPQPLPPQQAPRSTPTSALAAAPSTPVSIEPKKSTPKPTTKRTQTPGDGGTRGTPTPSATPVQTTLQLTPQHVRTTNRPLSRPTSQSPHPAATPTAIVNGLASSPPIAPSPALHAMTVAGSTAPSSSPHPPPQPIAQPPQAQPQPQLQHQIQQPRPPLPQSMKALGPHPQAYAQSTMPVNVQPAFKAPSAAQGQGQNHKAMPHSMTAQAAVHQQQQQYLYYLMHARSHSQAQPQAQVHAQGQGQASGQAQGVMSVQVPRFTQMVNSQVAQAQQQQQNGQTHPMSRTPMNAVAARANGNPQVTSRSPMPNANGQGQQGTPRHFIATPGQSQPSPQPQSQSQRIRQYQVTLQQQQNQQQQNQQDHQQQQPQQHHLGQSQDGSQPQPMYLMNMNPAMQAQFQLLTQTHQAQASGRPGAGHNANPWQPMSMGVGAMDGVAAFQQANGQPHAMLAAVAAQAKAAQPQSQGAGAR